MPSRSSLRARRASVKVGADLAVAVFVPGAAVGPVLGIGDGIVCGEAPDSATGLSDGVGVSSSVKAEALVSNLGHTFKRYERLEFIFVFPCFLTL
jgi:hypothetical protein